MAITAGNGLRQRPSRSRALSITDRHHRSRCPRVVTTDETVEGSPTQPLPIRDVTAVIQPITMEQEQRSELADAKKKARRSLFPLLASTELGWLSPAPPILLRPSWTMTAVRTGSSLESV